MTPLEEVTGMPTDTPVRLPLSMVTVEDQESVDPEMMWAAVDCRLLTSCRSSRPWSLSTDMAASSSSTFLALSLSFSSRSSERVCWSAVRLVKTLPSPWKGIESVEPR